MKTVTIDEIRKTGDVRAEEGQETVLVKVAGKTCRDNGVLHQNGESFRMEISLVPAHVAAGQVELAAKPPKADRPAPAGK